MKLTCDTVLLTFVVVQSLSHVHNSLQPHGLQHARLSCPLLSSGVCSTPCPLMPSNHLILYCLFSSCPQSKVQILFKFHKILC